ncbi:Protein kinase protein rad53 [Neophaeococcomyces mojaviensis]|uniref:Protein kinase protein rad53 n=1 Tax=Neophaeococcomyces mojaviensis TaxID=3383035 RepID=A0ACC3AEF8_9EURO|nr:Protein kinase protein rad53 [Knufia sp. JES_112]
MEGPDSQQPTQPTQQATQPYQDPRRRSRNLSEMSENDLADIICVLHANSSGATRAVQATMLAAPEHILQNEDLDGVTKDDLLYDPLLANRTREIALRMNSTVKKPKEGFLFGRNPDLCDVLLTDNPRDKLVSGIHFKIFVHEQGSLLIEDCSTNGTMLDDEVLRFKGKDGRPVLNSPKRVLRNGNIITVLVGPARQEIKFMVRIPNRTDYESLYEQKLRVYLANRGFAPNFASIRESSFGNHWNGGSTYNFTGLLGKGAFATVYRVQTRNEGTIYAAKEIDKRRFIRNGVLDIKFDNELQIMKRLKHPNIVDYIDCQIHDSWIYIIMEFIPYGELTKELQLRTRIPEPEAQQITRQTLRALDYLHRQGITHRDIKPDNILIASRKPLVIKLSDFGLSKSVIDQETFLKTFCGTLLYCAPEVYPDYGTYAQPSSKRRRSGDPPSRTAPYDSSADMWSFGAVIFHILAGKAPIMGRGENGGAQMLNNIMTKEVDFGPLHDVGVSNTAVDFVNGLLNRHPSLRPKEQDCFLHPWLRDIPDLLDYGDVSDVDFRPRNRLEDVQEGEEDEADEELINDLQRLTQNPEMLPPSDNPPSTSTSPERPTKKPKMLRAESTIPEELLYPPLPAFSQESSGKARESSGPRLFGEITPSILKSSGLFGVSAGSPAVATPVVPAAAITTAGPQSPAVPKIRSQMEQVSMNDFAKSAASRKLQSEVKRLDHMVPGADASYLQPPVFGSAASLLGAEAQLGLMHMGSPEAAVTDAPTPETTNPVTPETHNLTPTHSVTQPGKTPSQHPMPDLEVRRIDINLLSDEVAFAAEQQLREAAREENQRMKAQTFHAPAPYVPRALTNGAAKTFTTPAAPKPRTTVPDPQPHSSGGTEILRQLSTNTVTSKLELFGKLKPIAGSFDQSMIRLTSRSTLWGRAPQCNCRYGDLKDIRVPKFGMKIVFYAQGVERIERDGGDWTQVPMIRTIIATSATRGIWINDMHLSQQSDDGRAALFGKIYTGDVITIVDSQNPGEFLKYEVEILFGDSAQTRPEEEKPFVIQKEYTHHARMKGQSMQVISHSSEQNLSMPAPSNAVAVV